MLNQISLGYSFQSTLFFFAYYKKEHILRHINLPNINNIHLSTNDRSNFYLHDTTFLNVVRHTRNKLAFCYHCMAIISHSFPSTSFSLSPYLQSIRTFPRKLKPMPAVFGWDVGYTMGSLPIYHRANTEINTLISPCERVGSCMV